ncbi:hypothetical protein MTX26_18305 [Bradyrhizobium sp. ISRA443]|uniref:hypothetical protein n=1 Tax=unclassified Bradyrhizobium TaxID=2631580 RepID=UPI0024794399|nr:MULTISPECIES: hypothetical protein [unclassified Bradyrhizobium]WGS03322.1 hypothetical protein MTX18_18305 [Bradyrhizobium sp. ISRA437]WGS10206.1 hypothetical protein MTX26_18305 [Bradyrhizobium sp. ISRA443]
MNAGGERDVIDDLFAITAVPGTEGRESFTRRPSTAGTSSRPGAGHRYLERGSRQTRSRVRENARLSAFARDVVPRELLAPADDAALAGLAT